MTGAITWEFVRGLAIIVLSILVLGGFIVLTVKKSEDPAAMSFRWLITIVVMGFVFWKGLPLAGKGGMDAFIGLVYVMSGSIVMIFIWRRSIASLVADPFGSLYDGGSTPPDPHPAYSVAMSRQKQGRYLEAVAEIRKQLDRFPTDVEGMMMLAQIQAENLKDLSAAELTIEHLCSQEGHAAKNIVFALYSMADWHLAVGQDAAAARRELEKIVQKFPGSEFALGASQRIAHLGNPEMRLDGQQKQFVVREGIRNLGLMRDQPAFAPTETEPGQAASQYVKHLEQHPFDTEAREKLAIIYASHYSRLDLAADQLDQMISQPGAPAKSIGRWLNLLADLQIQGGADYETVKQTLQRIIDRDPAFAAADIARNRLSRLKLEMKSTTNRQAVKMGSYEQNIGLKGRGGGNGNNMPAQP
jgi:outer membrane protein assembly factor BamD (BamD/ComL family)